MPTRTSLAASSGEGVRNRWSIAFLRASRPHHSTPPPEGLFRANREDGHIRPWTPVRSPGRGETALPRTPASARACEVATLVLDCSGR